MKIKTTKKHMRDSYEQVISIGYCNAQYLLQYTEPIAYSTRAEGWACDYYVVNNVLISTGYTPLTSRNTNSNYETVRKYDELAQKIVHDYTIDYVDKKFKVNTLLWKYIDEVSQ